MRVVLERFGHGYESTLGRLYIPGERPCFTLEDQRQDGEKVPGETRIPEGEYNVTLRTHGGFHSRYSDRFPHLHRGMLWLRDVPDFEYILIHTGNHDGHTAGCILVGERPAILGDGEFNVHQSRGAYRRIYPAMSSALLAGEPVTIDVRSRS